MEDKQVELNKLPPAPEFEAEPPKGEEVLFTISPKKLVSNEVLAALVSRDEKNINSKPSNIIQDLDFVDDPKNKDRYLIYGSNKGIGGYSEVYMGYDDVLKRLVAVKVGYSAKENSDAEKDLEKEAIIQAKFSHPNLVTIHDIVRATGPNGEIDKNILVMEWLDPDKYKQLHKTASEMKAQDPALIARVARGVSNAITYMSESGYVHKDIKPSNMFVSDTEVKLGDFGIWGSNDDLPEGAGVNVDGTSSYMSPEQVMGEKIDERSEVFSLGASIYKMVTGKDLFFEDTAQRSQLAVVNKVYPGLVDEKSPRGSDQEWRTALDPILKKALEKAPENRYQTAKEFADALEEALTPFLLKDEKRQT